jgi:hypothetical protein
VVGPVSFVGDGTYDEDGYVWAVYREDDVYDDAANEADVPDDLDDRPLWDRGASGAPHDEAAVAPCRRCYRLMPLDPYCECERCRIIGGWCRWCGIEPIEYTSLSLGRTCYRWMQRNERRYSGEEFEHRRRRTIERRWARKGL